jgi:magnesium transporter
MIKTYFYNHDEHAMYHDVDLSSTQDLLASPENLLWIDLYDCSESELNFIGRFLISIRWRWRTVFRRVRGRK